MRDDVLRGRCEFAAPRRGGKREDAIDITVQARIIANVGGGVSDEDQLSAREAPGSKRRMQESTEQISPEDKCNGSQKSQQDHSAAGEGLTDLCHERET